jgi:hypothetical protein
MKKLALVVLIILASQLAVAQNLRWDYAATTTGSTSGQLVPVYAIRNAPVSFYVNCTALPCTSPASVYTSFDNITSCPSNAQVVLQQSTTCQETADSSGNFGGYFNPGNYQYTITYQNQVYGPYQFSVGPGNLTLNYATVYNVQSYGAKGDGVWNDFKATAGSNIIQLVDVFYTFAPADVGKRISVPFVDSDHKTLYTTITGYIDSTHVTVGATPVFSYDGTGTFSNAAVWATDDTAAINAAISAGSLVSPRNGRGEVFFPCGIYATSAQISLTGAIKLNGQTQACSAIMYMGTTDIDATVEGATSVNTWLRQGVYLTSTNHPDIGTCSGSGCSPALPPDYIPGQISQLSIYGNKFSQWGVSLIAPTDYKVESVAFYSGAMGCFYSLNGVQDTYEHFTCYRDLFYGGGSPNNGFWFDGSGTGQGPIPTQITSPAASFTTGTALYFNQSSTTVVNSGQFTTNHQSLNITNSAGQITFNGNLFEAGTTASVISGNNTFINNQFSDVSYTINGNNNGFFQGLLAAPVTIIGANNTFFQVAVSDGPGTFLDQTNTTQFIALSSFGGIGSPISRYPMNQFSSIGGNGQDSVIHTQGSWPIALSPSTTPLASTKFGTNQAWKMILIGDWNYFGSGTPSLPGIIELTDSSNTVTVAGQVITFTLDGSGHIVATNSSANLNPVFSGDVYILPRNTTPGGGGSKSIQMAGDIASPSLTVASGTSMTGNAGTGTRLQHNDGTGTSGNFAKFGSSADTSDSGLAVTSVPQKVNTCGTTTTCTNTLQTSPRLVWGTVTMSSGTATVTGMTAFTSTSSYSCTCTDSSTTPAACSTQNTSTSSITVKGGTSSVIRYQCVGN